MSGWPQQLPGDHGRAKGVPVAEARRWATTWRHSTRTGSLRASTACRSGRSASTAPASTSSTCVPSDGLEDSPAGQLAWIVDKVVEWTHDEAPLEEPHLRARHLAGVLLFWLTRTAASAADVVYAQYGSLFADPTVFAPSGVPTGVLVAAEDISIRRCAEQSNAIVRWTDLDHGGHVAALEQPDDLVADLRGLVDWVRLSAPRRRGTGSTPSARPERSSWVPRAPRCAGRRRP